MNIEELHELLDEYHGAISWTGKCHDCGKQVTVNVTATENGIVIEGGSYYKTEDGEFLKCDDCYKENPHLKNYQECEVYARCVGYLRPVAQFNQGKLQEYRDRKNYKI